MQTSSIIQELNCYHCGERCVNNKIHSVGKIFCCEGCKMVFQILTETDLCDYYNLNKNPGISQQIKVRKDKFAFLDDKKIQNQIISFSNDEQIQVTFYLPQMHCSSCLYLLENLYRINSGVVSSKVNFTRKEVDIVLLTPATSLRKVTETLTSIGYEPYISLNDLKQKRPAINKSMVYQLGVAGFCFGNIMLMSFPEYLGIDASDTGLRSIFRWMNFGLAIPVLLFSALPFYTSSWKSLKHKFLNIDTPIAITVLKEEKEVPTTLPEIKPGDTLLIHNEELIPADGILTKGKAFIDYSFVTGESLPVLKEVGELIYAGGKQTEGNIELLVVKEVAQSYLTKLWNRDEFKKEESANGNSFVHLLSRYFTYIVLIIAIATAIYWQINDASKMWTAVTAVFIIACPCALLLSNSFTNGNILRILSKNQFFLKNAETIEEIAKVSNIVFDKTGTLTTTQQQDISYEGKKLTVSQEKQVAALAACSTHPLSKALAKHLLKEKYLQVAGFKEKIGQGIEGFVNEDFLKLGSYQFVTGNNTNKSGTKVFVSIENKFYGYYIFNNHYREEIPRLIKQLKASYNLSVITGDNESEKENLQKLLGNKTELFFHQKPEDKLHYIKHLQRQSNVVMMIGDGLNDAGALKQSNIGVAVAEQTNNFTPSSDAIIEAKQLSRLPQFIALCLANRNIVIASFVLSIVYNIIGLFFAVQGSLSPLIAAILMPLSSLSIVLITFGSSSLMAKWLKL